VATAVQNRLPRSTAQCPRGEPQCAGQAREASPAWAGSGGESSPRGAARPQLACAGVQQGPAAPARSPLHRRAAVQAGMK